jgi:hypothetical protein
MQLSGSLKKGAILSVGFIEIVFINYLIKGTLLNPVDVSLTFVLNQSDSPCLFLMGFMNLYPSCRNQSASL